MVNPDYNILKDWMFGKLNFLLKDIKPNSDYNILKMSFLISSVTSSITNLFANIFVCKFSNES